MPTILSGLFSASEFIGRLSTVERQDFPVSVPHSQRQRALITERRDSGSRQPEPPQQITMEVSPTIEDGYVISKLRSEDYKTEKSRVRAGYMHASSLINVCPRMYVLCVKNGLNTSRPVTSADRLVWAYGRAAEKHIRTSFLGATGGTGVYGKWRCKCGNVEYVGFWENRTHVNCDRCGKHLEKTDYEEATLFDHDAHIVGNPDMLFRVSHEDNRMYVIEVKSMAGETFEALKAPMGDHVMQAFLYHHLLRVNGFQTANKVVILYASKKYSRTSPVYKEFHVSTDTEFYENSISRMLSNARAVKNAFENDSVPVRELCSSLSDKLASTCPAAMECFNGGV